MFTQHGGTGSQAQCKNPKKFKKRHNQGPPSCNCQKSKVGECPLPGACNQDGVIYQAIVTNSSGGQECYVGLAKNFKKRYAKHKRSMKDKLPEESTTLSTHFWKEKDSGGEPKIIWKVLESNIANFNPVTRSCKLCLREKFNIVLKPHLATINSRHEMFSQCRHMGSKLMGKPPD